MNKDDGVSPVRVSKLKKRRRVGRESIGSSNACTLQNLGSSPKQNRQSNVVTTATNSTSTSRGDGYYKENLLNGNPALSGNQSMPPMQGDGVDTSYGACDMNQSTKIDGMKDVSSMSTTNYKSTLGFIDDMDQSKLISSLPSILGIDIDKYKTNSKDFQQCLERSFEYTNINNSNTVNNKDVGVYHPLVNRIDPHSTKSSTNITIDAEKDKLSFAFPRCTNSSEKNAANKEEVVNPYDIFQHLNLVRKSEHGMTLPASWYQFPQTQTKSSPSSVIPAASVNEKVSAATTNMEQTKKQPVLGKSKSFDDEEDADDEMDLFNVDDTITKHDYKADHQNDFMKQTAKKNPPKVYLPAKDNEKYSRLSGQQQTKRAAANICNGTQTSSTATTTPNEISR